MNRITVDNFAPTKICSGEKVNVSLNYTTDRDSFIVVNEGSYFDATPGKLSVQAGDDLVLQTELTIEKQPGALSDNCLIRFTLGAASYTILVIVS